MRTFDTFTQAYIEAMLWAECHSAEGSENDGESFDSLGYSADDITAQGLDEIIADCRAFQDENRDDIGTELEQAGHDFYLTRNRHGAGFWDGDWPDEVGKRLTRAAHAYGTQGLMAEDEEGNAPLHVHN